MNKNKKGENGAPSISDSARQSCASRYERNNRTRTLTSYINAHTHAQEYARTVKSTENQEKIIE